MLPPHLPFKLEIQTCGGECGELSMMLVDFGKAGSFPNTPFDHLFSGFLYCDGVVPRPVNANTPIITDLSKRIGGFTGHCLFMRLAPDHAVNRPRPPSVAEFETYLVFELAHPSWKQIRAALSRASKQYRFRRMFISAFTERFLKKYIQMHRMRRGITGEVSNVSGIKVST